MPIPSRWWRYVRPMRDAADVLADLRRLPVVTLAELTRDRPFLVLAPHPDDETLGCGGLLALAAARGQDARVRIVSDGTGSHPTLAPARLRQMREAETRAAMALLGIDDAALGFLGVADGAVPRRGPLFRHLVDRLTDECCDAGVATLFATWEHDPHPDHRAVAALARAVAVRTGARLFLYPVWGWTLSDREWLPVRDIHGGRLDIAAVLDRKRRAIAAHASQMAGLPGHDVGAFTMPPHLRQVFEQRFETFVAG